MATKIAIKKLLEFCSFRSAASEENAGIAQLVERNLAKVEVVGSRPISRSIHQKGSLGFPFFLAFGPLAARPLLGALHQSAAPVTLAAEPVGGQCPDGEISRHCGLKIHRKSTIAPSVDGGNC